MDGFIPRIQYIYILSTFVLLVRLGYFSKSIAGCGGRYSAIWIIGCCQRLICKLDSRISELSESFIYLFNSNKIKNMPGVMFRNGMCLLLPRSDLFENKKRRLLYIWKFGEGSWPQIRDINCTVSWKPILSQRSFPEIFESLPHISWLGTINHTSVTYWRHSSQCLTMLSRDEAWARGSSGSWTVGNITLYFWIRSIRSRTTPGFSFAKLLYSHGSPVTSNKHGAPCGSQSLLVVSPQHRAPFLSRTKVKLSSPLGSYTSRLF